MAEEIQEAVQIIRVAYDGIEIAMKVGSGGIAAMQKAIDGIPADEIAFIHDAKTDAQRDALFKEMRTGKKKVLIGSTDK